MKFELWSPLTQPFLDQSLQVTNRYFSDFIVCYLQEIAIEFIKYLGRYFHLSDVIFFKNTYNGNIEKYRKGFDF